jgi:hypothetical protein
VLSLVLAALCVIAVLFGIFGTAYDVVLLATIHNNSFASHWIKQMSLMWGETVQSGVIQFLYANPKPQNLTPTLKPNTYRYALYSPVSRRDIYVQRKFIKDEMKKRREELEDKYPEPRSYFNRFRFNRENAKLVKCLIDEEKKHVIPPQKLLSNASRRESAFLMCMNKIVEFDSKIFKTDEDRTVILKPQFSTQISNAPFLPFSGTQ